MRMYQCLKAISEFKTKGTPQEMHDRLCLIVTMAKLEVEKADKDDAEMAQILDNAVEQ